MKLSKLREDPPKLPQCEAELTPQAMHYWKNIEQYKPEDNRCQNQSKYLIDGKYYCRKHAAYIVLDKTIEEKANG